MSTISEASLPGVGRKFQIETASGERLVIVIHNNGTRELYHFTRKDPNRASSVLTLVDSEARQIAGILGGLTYVPQALPTAQVVLDDLVLEWYTIPARAACIGQTLEDLKLRQETGASIVAILEPDRTKRINPEPNTPLSEGATLIVAGDRKTVTALKQFLVHGKVG